MKKYLPTYTGCFVCGKHNDFGLKRRFYVADAPETSEKVAVCVEMTFPKEYEGFKGVVHGGIITAIIDEAMGWASTVKTTLMYVTADLNVRFVKPVKVGEALTFKGWLVKNRRKMTVNEGVVISADGEILVKASGKFFALSEAESREVNDYLHYEEGTYNLFSK